MRDFVVQNASVRDGTIAVAHSVLSANMCVIHVYCIWVWANGGPSFFFEIGHASATTRTSADVADVVVVVVDQDRDEARSCAWSVDAI